MDLELDGHVLIKPGAVSCLFEECAPGQRACKIRAKLAVIKPAFRSIKLYTG